MAANRVAAIDDTDPIRKFSIDPGIYTNLQNPAEQISLQKGFKLIRNFSIDPASIVDTDTIADAIFADAVSETSILGPKIRDFFAMKSLAKSHFPLTAVIVL